MSSSKQATNRSSVPSGAWEADSARAATERHLDSSFWDTDVLFGAVIDASPMAIIILDPKGTVLAWSRAAEAIFAYSADEVLGKPYPVVPEGGEKEFDALLQQAMAGERLRDVHVRRKRKDGRLRDVRASSAPIYDDDGETVRGTVYAMEDMTERFVMEEKLRHAQKLEAVGQLTGGIAHDFNNLLSIMTMNLDLLEDRLEGDAEAGELLESARAGAFRGAELTQRLLAFGRRQSLLPVITDLNELLPELAKVLRRTLGDHIAVTTSPAEDLWSTFVDTSQVENAILNLAINARDAMPEGGRLHIETGNAHLDAEYATGYIDVSPGDYVMISVSDTGCGMPPELMEQAFDPFFTTKEAGHGTGLGLSMVYGFAKQSGGHVRIYSEVGHGTTVKLYLPRTTGEGPAVRESGASIASLMGDGEVVLVVEDETKVREAAVRLLNDLNYRVLQASNGHEALAHLEDGGRIDVLFTDVVMSGGISGYEVATRVRAQRPELPVVLTSGFSEAFVDGEGNGLGDRAQFLAKPYRKQDLAAAIGRALDKSPD